MISKNIKDDLISRIKVLSIIEQDFRCEVFNNELPWMELEPHHMLNVVNEPKQEDLNELTSKIEFIRSTIDKYPELIDSNNLKVFRRIESNINIFTEPHTIITSESSKEDKDAFVRKFLQD